MTHEPRAATPAPTLPQPDGHPHEKLMKRLAERLSTWKVLLSIAGGVFMLGGAVGILKRDIATQNDIERARQGATVALDVVRDQTTDLRARMPVVELAVKELKADLKAETAIIRAQLWEIAKTVGARQVAQPTIVMPAQTAPEQGSPP